MATNPEELPLVLILKPFPSIPSFQEKFSNKFRSLKGTDLSVPVSEFFRKECQSVKALVCGAKFALTKDILNCLPSLGCIVLTCVGLDNIDLDECRKRGIVIGNAGTVYSEDVADFAIGLLIDVLRGISSGHRFVRSGLWSINTEFPLGSKLSGKRVGILGLGSIGSEVAKRLEAFSCVISYTSRTKKPSVPFSYYPNVIDLASHNDILILTCSLNKETFHIINKDVMSALGKKGIIINVGRGALVDEKEMVRCLVQGEIGGAGLDVFEKEPYIPEELLEKDNIVLAPHVAVVTVESYSALHELIISNLEAFFSNKPLLSLVKYN
ncbi:glyoxylate/hydroxypyruvate reductase HPR3-like isoform X1 [Papaver somniferum]|uniref:glyoxylate/hydroxypyruvate reductase HPR3-like isoform X1 n=1 Tax=Papaver somniferum TaxID=3469 RepID=UPI000E6F6C5E|nr:glyoxylate/hydroxypyruvate reductase HPR3-like isoform X1 [Papaver somniferum]